MQKRRALFLFFSVCCVLLLLTTCGAVQGSPAATGGPSFRETTPLVIRPPLFQVNNVVWSPDDNLLVTTNAQKTADGTSEYHIAQVWKVTPGAQLCTYQNTSTSYIDHLAWSPNNRRIVSISGTGFSGDPIIAQVWDAATCGHIFRLHGTLGQADDLSWSPDGAHIASWHENPSSPMQIWDTTTGNLSFKVGEQYPFPYAMAWSPDGKKIVVLGEPLKMQVVDVATGQPQITYHIDANQNIVTWSPDGQYIASAGADTTVRVWYATTGRTAFIYRGHTETVLAVAWSPDSKRITSSGVDGTIQIW